MEQTGTLVIIFNAGKDVGITCMAWLRAAKPWTVFVASGNGYLNCVSFDRDEVGDFVSLYRPALLWYVCLTSYPASQKHCGQGAWPYHLPEHQPRWLSDCSQLRSDDKDILSSLFR